MLQGVIPSLLVTDMESTLRFYEKLGFVLTGHDAERPMARWAEVRRDAVVLRFYLDAPTGTEASPLLSGTLYVPTTDIDRLAEEISARVQFEWGPETMEYGVREFGIRDPSGYLVAFAQALAADYPAS